VTPSEAKHLLSLHSGSSPDTSHPKWETGFLGQLRPFRKVLRPENFDEVAEAIRTLAPMLQAETLDRQVMNDLWGICHLARLWGIEPDGMLRRNGLITPQQIETLDDWVSRISFTVMLLLDGADPESALAELQPRRPRPPSDQG